MRVDPNDRIATNKSNDASSTNMFLLIGLLVACAFVSVWYYGCDLGIRPCTKTLGGVEVTAVNGGDQDDMLNKIQIEPCNRELMKQAINVFADQLLDSQKADIWFGMGSSRECTFNNFERASLFVESYRSASKASDYERSKKALTHVLMHDSRDASTYLTLGHLELGAERFEESVDAFRMGIHLAAGYGKTGVQTLWFYSESLQGARLFCEAISVLDHLSIRTKRQPRVISKVKDLRELHECGLKGGDPIIIRQNQSGVIVVDVEINGVDGRFVFDSGASLTLLAEGFAERSGVAPDKKSAISMITANGEALAYPARVPNLKFGGESWSNVPVVVSQKGLGRYDGLLGIEFISQFNIEKSGDTWKLTRN